MSIAKNQSNTELGFHERLQTGLSTYTEKVTNEDGSITLNVVQNPYFLINDIWNLSEVGVIPNFCNHPLTKTMPQHIHFYATSQSVNLELKYFIYQKLFRDEWSLTTVFHDQRIRYLTAFLNEEYPTISSILDLDVEKAELKWLSFLARHNVKTKKTNREPYGEYEVKSPMASFLRMIHSYLYAVTDSREEWVKDRWDVRVLYEQYGIGFNKSRSQHYIDFLKIEQPTLREGVKRYIKQRLLSHNNFTWNSACTYMTYLPQFINFIISKEPTWMNLGALKRPHIEQFIEWLHRYTKNRSSQKNSNPERYIAMSLTVVNAFLEYIQRHEYDIAPETHVRLLIFQEDKPKLKKKSIDQIDYIPDYVLDQLFANLNYLNIHFQPVIWVAFKTGLRISDVLGLTQDCLVRLNGKYYIETDIEKTYVQGHRIPIDGDLANMIAVLIHQSKTNSTSDNNPDRFIFVRYSGTRKGRPYDQRFINKDLNRLATDREIKDENGELFHFRMHQFRHTYAVKMLNGGADILTVQELLAHASPEMTLSYARLLDDTKRKAFEKVVKEGVFTFDLNGEIHQVSDGEDIPEDIMDMLWKNEKLNAVDNPYGSCRARVNGNCPIAVEPPCLTANNGKPCFDLAVGISDMDIKKYELHIESTTKMIEAAKQYGREDMIEANQKNLERYQNIYEAIKSGNVIFGRFDRVRRELDKKKGVKRG